MSCPSLPGSSGRKGPREGFRPLWDPGSCRNMVAELDARVGGEGSMMGELCKQGHSEGSRPPEGRAETDRHQLL